MKLQNPNFTTSQMISGCIRFAAAVIATFVQVSFLVANPGDLDEIDAVFGASGGSCYATAAQPDGKIIIAGSFTSIQGVTRTNIARLNADGSLDMTFDPKPDFAIRSVVPMQDGKILIGGAFRTLQPNGAPSPITRNRIARLNQDGSVDPSFDPNANNFVSSMAVQADGKILLGGKFTTLQPNGAPTATTRNRIARINADGSLDADFDPNANNEVFCVALQPDGAVLLGGIFTSLQPNGAAIATTRNRVARVNSDGTLDTVFDPNVGSDISCIALQPDGKVLIAGAFTYLKPNGTTDPIFRNRIARLNSDGTLDPSINVTTNSTIFSVSVQADGKILIGGWISSSNSGAIRLEAGGTLDTSFNPKPDNTVYTLCQQGDGKVILGGVFSNLQPNGAPSPTVRKRFARVFNNPVTEAFLPLDSGTISWTRGGSAPDMSQVTFESSADGGVTWTTLGNASRVGVSSEWRLTGLALAASGKLRARGRTVSGWYNGSGSLIESVIDYSGFGALAPTVTSVTPDSGSTAGGNTVTITGTNFDAVTGITFGGLPANSFVVVDPQTITAVTPPNSPGESSVLVSSHPGGTNQPNGLYTYGPTITKISPASGSPRGGTSVTITGRDFLGTTGVTFGGAAARSVVVVDDTTITAVTPPGPEGNTSVLIHAPIGTNPANTHYRYAEPSLGGYLEDMDIGLTGSKVFTTATQPDGKIIIGGTFTSIAGVPRNHIARLNADGTLDQVFDPNVNCTFNVSDYVRCIVVLPNGKILIGGTFTSLQPNGAPSPTAWRNLARLNEDGTLDTSFNPDLDNWVNCVELQADGRILVGGLFSNVNVDNGVSGRATRKYVCRLNANGSLDPSFDPNPSNEVVTIVELPDGKILLGGRFEQFQPFKTGDMTNRHFIARLNADGTLDGAYTIPFGGTGTYSGTFLAPRPNGTVKCITVQPDGKILIGGGFANLTYYRDPYTVIARGCLARLNPDGTLDMDFNPNANVSINSMAFQADGRIVLGGDFSYLQPNGSPEQITRMRYARVNPDGSLDMDFDPNAWQYSGMSVELQASGRILVGGWFTAFQPNGAASPAQRIAFAQLSNDPAFEDLYVENPNTVTWMRGGCSPDFRHVVFEKSSDGGATWTALGSASRVGSSLNWRLTGVSLPTSGKLRAFGRTASGFGNGSRGWIKSEITYSGLGAPEISVTESGGTEVTSGFSISNLGAVAIGGHRLFKITIHNQGGGDLIGILATLDSGEVGDYSIISVPPSVIPAGGTANMTVRFAPSALWARSTTLRIFSNDGDEDPFELALTGTGVLPNELFVSVLESAGLIDTDAEPAAIPFSDGVVNVLKYAFNLNLAGSDSRTMPKNGDAGLPAGDLIDEGVSALLVLPDGAIESGVQKVWRVQYVRRKRSGLIYTAVKSTTLEPDSYVTMTGEETVEDIDEEWERVSILEPFDPAVTPRLFTKVEVSLP